jgi:hypothetical protein
MSKFIMDSQISLAKLLINYLSRSLRDGYRFYRKSDNYELCTTRGILESLLTEQDVMTIPPKPGMKI